MTPIGDRALVLYRVPSTRLAHGLARTDLYFSLKLTTHDTTHQTPARYIVHNIYGSESLRTSIGLESSPVSGLSAAKALYDLCTHAARDGISIVYMCDVGLPVRCIMQDGEVFFIPGATLRNIRCALTS